MAIKTLANLSKCGGGYSRAIRISHHPITTYKRTVVPQLYLSSSSSCYHCGSSEGGSVAINYPSGRVSHTSPPFPCQLRTYYSSQWRHHRNQFQQTRTISTSNIAARKKDFMRAEKLPIFDYGKVHPENKRLYVFGQAGHGGLGLQNLFDPEISGVGMRSKESLYMHRPVRHSFSGTHAVKDIATGHGFTLISIKPRNKENAPFIFGCGYNHRSQLGFQPGPKEKPLTCVINIVPLSLPLDKSSKVLALAAGRGHSLIAVQGKGLIALGDNSFGQCGRKIIEDEQYSGSKYICRIPPMGPTSDDDVVQIATCFDVNICLTKGGSVYTFGCNNQGQLGRGKDVGKPWIPVQVQGDLKGEIVKKVATSGASVVAVSEKGELFGWGLNDGGQVNHETLSNIYYEPIHIKMPRRVGKIIDIAVGEMSTLVLNEYGNVYVWGVGRSLGLGPKDLVVKTPKLIPPPLFGRNEFSPDTAVVKIVSSSKYAAAVNSIGDLYMWGYNDNGCLGLGKLQRNGDYQYFPMKVTLGVPVYKVSLGCDHTVVLARGGF